MIVTEADVAESRSDCYWTVEARPWEQVLPEPPDDVIALLAPPVLVSATPFATSVQPSVADAEPPVVGDDPGAADDDEEPDEGQERYPSPLQPCASSEPPNHASRLLVPAPPRRATPRAAGRRG